MVTYPQAIESFLQHCLSERRLSPHTIRAYRLDLTRFEEFMDAFDKQVPLGGLTKEHLRAYQQSLAPLRPRTVCRRIAALRSFLHHAEQEKIVSVNPFDGFRARVRIGRPLPRTIGQKAVERFFRALYRREAQSARAQARKQRDIAIVELLFGTGLRVGELSGLSDERIDMESGSIRIHGKGSRERLVPIVSEELRNALAEHSRQRPAANGPRPLFFNRAGHRPLSEDSIRRVIRRVARDAGLGKVTPHMFRHTFATLLLDRGMDLRVIQRLLGHSSIVTTTIYAQVSERSQRKALESANLRALVRAGREKPQDN